MPDVTGLYLGIGHEGMKCQMRFISVEIFCLDDLHIFILSSISKPHQSISYGMIVL